MSNKLKNESSANWIWLTVIVIFGLVMRAMATISFHHVPESDELAYMSMAFNLISRNEITDSMGNRAMYNVGYPLFVLAPVFLFFGQDLLAARLVNVILGGASIVLIYFVAKEAGAGRLGRFTAAIIWALYLPASVYTVYMAKENLMIPLMLGVIWCGLRLAKTPSKIAALGCGALIGLLALTGNAALSLVAAVALALIFNRASLPQRAGMASLIIVASLAIATPWVARNMHVLGASVLNTNGGFNLYLGNNPAATGYFVSIADTPRGPDWKTLRRAGEIQASETLKQDAIAWIKSNIPDFVILSLKKVFYFWKPPFHEGQGEQSSAEKFVRVLWGIQFVALVAAALSSLLLERLRNGQSAILWVAVAGYTAAHMLFYVIYRYREPIMPLIAVLASLAFESLIHRGLQWPLRLSNPHAPHAPRLDNGSR